MHCENTFCIYNKNYICTIDNITLDATVTCQECILVDVPDYIIEQFKNDMLNQQS